MRHRLDFHSRSPVPLDKQTDQDPPSSTCSTGLWDPALSLPPTTWLFLLSAWLPLPNLLTLSSRSSSPLYLTPLVISAVFGLSQHLYAESSLTVTPSSALSTAPWPTSPRVPASPLHLMPHSLSWYRMPGLLPTIPQKVFPSLLSILPGAPAKGHSAVLDAFPSLIPRLLTVYRTSADFKLYPESNSSSVPPIHCPPCFIQRESQGFRVVYRVLSRFSPLTLLLLVFSHTGLLAALEAQRAPPTVESWHWLFPPALGVYSDVICSVRLAWLSYLNPSCRSLCPHSQFPISNAFSQVLPTTM